LQLWVDDVTTSGAAPWHARPLPAGTPRRRPACRWPHPNSRALPFADIQERGLRNWTRCSAVQSQARTAAFHIVGNIGVSWLAGPPCFPHDEAGRRHLGLHTAPNSSGRIPPLRVPAPGRILRESLACPRRCNSPNKHHRLNGAPAPCHRVSVSPLRSPAGEPFPSIRSVTPRWR
jgi:hypothetical protein